MLSAIVCRSCDLVFPKQCVIVHACDFKISHFPENGLFHSQISVVVFLKKAV